MISVIGFDLDDTLWSVAPVIKKAELLLAVWLEDTVPGYNYDHRKLAIIRDSLIENEPSLAHKLTQLREQIIKNSLGSSVSKNRAISITETAMEIFLNARNDVEFFEGATDTLFDLARSYRLGAITNGNADIVRLGLSHVLSFAFYAEQVGAPKPFPDLFLAALAHTNCKPSEFVYVGDDPVKDIDAANALGINTVWMRSNKERSSGESEPDRVIDDIRELPAVIKGLVGS